MFQGPQYPGFEYYNHSSSDKYSDVAYVQIKPGNGWTFSGDAEYVHSNFNADGSLVLNEYRGPGVAQHSLTDLTAGQTYYVQFLRYGDNIPVSQWQLDYGVDGLYTRYLDGVDVGPGANPGGIVSYSFVATANTEDLNYTETTLSAASPIIDNIVVEDQMPAGFMETPNGYFGPNTSGGGSPGVPEPPAAIPEAPAWIMMILGLGLTGAAMRSRVSRRLLP